MPYGHLLYLQYISVIHLAYFKHISDKSQAYHRNILGKFISGISQAYLTHNSIILKYKSGKYQENLL